MAVCMVLAADAVATAAPVRINLRTTTGNFLGAGDASTGYAMSATADGVGFWETFTVERADGAEVGVLHSGDRIHLRTFQGRYVMAANDGGAGLTGEALIGRQWETFTIEKLGAGAEIIQGDAVTLRADNGINFVMAVNGGGGAVTASSRNRAQWERFTVAFENFQLVQLQTFTGQRVGAANGGGGGIDAVSRPQIEWQTFGLIDRSRRSGLRDGDQVALQTFNGKFASAVGGGGGAVSSSSNRAGAFESFTIHKVGGGDIGPTDSVSFTAADGVHFLMAAGGGGGALTAQSTLAREWETFGLRPAEQRPMSAPQALSAPAGASYPFAPTRARASGAPKIALFTIGFGDRPFDPTIANSDLVNFMHGGTGSVAAWVSSMTNGAFSIQNAGTFGPMTVPWNYVVIPSQDYWTGIMQLATARGFNFAAQDRNGDGRVTQDELMLVVLDSSNAYSLGQKKQVSFSFAGKTYDGLALFVGINAAGNGAQGRAQLTGVKGTVTHEISHMLFDTPDRYYTPFPPRGDVVATGSNTAEWETIALVAPNGVFSSDPVSAGMHVRLQNVFDGDYLVADGSALQFLNRGGSVTDALGEFIVEAPNGGALRQGDPIALRSASTGKLVSAKLGGGDVVQVNTSAVGSWETFTVDRAAGLGTLRLGDSLVLRTSVNNPYNTAFVLMGAPNGRHSDAATIARGWWNDWNSSYAGSGAGGKFDIMDFDKRPGILSPYDRFIRGWLSPSVLVPGNRACYALDPTVDSPSALLLWDPLVPDELYTLENRQFRASFDEVPSSGLVISWINDHANYWNQWGATDRHDYPAVISAAAPTLPPNMYLTLPLLPELLYKRNAPDAAFRSGVHVLPKADGTPSRFELSVTSSAASAQIVVCTH